MSTWPINKVAARAPEGWPGWPDGKELALKINHYFRLGHAVIMSPVP
jgi:hypothetical protein